MTPIFFSLLTIFVTTTTTTVCASPTPHNGPKLPQTQQGQPQVNAPADFDPAQNDIDDLLLDKRQVIVRLPTDNAQTITCSAMPWDSKFTVECIKIALIIPKRHMIAVVCGELRGIYCAHPLEPYVFAEDGSLHYEIFNSIDDKEGLLKVD